MASGQDYSVLMLNGPNLNLLGEREPHLYGSDTLETIFHRVETLGQTLQPPIVLALAQTNHEGDLIDWVHRARHSTHGLILNAGAYTHTSIALRDAILAYPHPVIEVHLSNVFKRESFRHHSYLSDVVSGVIVGFGPDVYRLALLALHEKLSTEG